MNKTTLIKKNNSMLQKPLEKCHEGKGAVNWTNVLHGSELTDRGVNFFHDDILAPGVSIGIHKHTTDEEYYYILSGKGVMTLGDERFDVAAGDITAVFPGGMHGLENNGKQNIRIVVISVKTKPN